MVIMNNYLDLSINENQMLVAQDWIIYRERIIISEELRYQIEDYLHDFQLGIISNIDFYHLTLDSIFQEIKARNN